METKVDMQNFEFEIMRHVILTNNRLVLIVHPKHLQDAVNI